MQEDKFPTKGSVDLLNKQTNNDYLENEADEEVVESHNIDETAYRFRVSQSLVQLVNRWNTESSTRLTKAIERLNLDHYVSPKLKCPVFDSENLERDKLAYPNIYREFENCCLSGVRYAKHVASKTTLRDSTSQKVTRDEVQYVVLKMRKLPWTHLLRTWYST